VIHFIEDSAINLVNAALSHRLYVPNFSLRHSLRAFTFHNENKESLSTTFNALKAGVKPEEASKYSTFKIKVIAEDNNPFGVAVFDPTDSFTVQIYIKKAYRQKGYGTQLLQELLSCIENKEDICVGNGVKGSMEFWKKNLEEKCIDAASLQWHSDTINVEKAEKKLKTLAF